MRIRYLSLYALEQNLKHFMFYEIDVEDTKFKIGLNKNNKTAV